MHRGHAGRLVGIALVVVALAAGLVPVAATVGAAATADFTVSLSATPSYGTPPLTVAFQASVTTGTPTSYNWTFGDGSFYNGTNASAADPSHTFAAPGEYNVTIAVFEGGTSAIGSIAVHVVAELLAAQVSASALAGTAPLTVTFVASVSGGTGTYVNFSWSFGDGGSGIGATIRYTFDHPGSYHVLLAVYDSANATTTAGAWVPRSCRSRPGSSAPSSSGSSRCT
jgi:PKD repeat protein